MDELTRQAYEGLLVDDDLLLEQLLREYRACHERDVDVDLARLPKAERRLVRGRLAARKRELRDALKAGVVDSRAQLSGPLRKRFRDQVSSFNPDDNPESIPKVFRDGQCNIFGHICPVFFAAEAISETSTSRRRGRYIPFATRVRGCMPLTEYGGRTILSGNRS